MQRFLYHFVLGLFVLLTGPMCVRAANIALPVTQMVFSQTDQVASAVAPALGTDKWADKHSISRQEGMLLNPWKLIALLFIFFFWVRLADWINRDSQTHHLGYARWNAITVFPFAAAMVLAFMLPFAIGFSILTLIVLALFIVYSIFHNRSVADHQKVFTKSWWRYFFADMGKKVGMKIDTERVPDYEKGPKVDLAAMGAGGDTENQANLIRARQSPGYLFVKELIADMQSKRSTRVLLDYSSQGMARRYQIDGVWHNGEGTEREPADVMLAVLKTLANLNINERVQRQVGTLGAKFEGHKYTVHLESQGTKTGERVQLSLDDNKIPFNTLSELGMREKTAATWLDYMSLSQGMTIFSALPGDGLTTLIDTSVADTDRLMRDWVTVEDIHHQEREIENVDRTTYDTAKGERPASVLPGLIRKYPDVYIVRDFVDAECGELLFQEIKDERFVVTSAKAKDAPEALLRMLLLKVPQKDFASLISAVLYQRLIRKLCNECKIGYEPTPDVLQKLGIPAGRVQALFRSPKPEEIDKPCEACHGIGFHGQTGIFELLSVNDEIREILAKQPKLELLRRAARAAGMRSLQEEGILLVAKGITSLPELMRVLKQ